MLCRANRPTATPSSKKKQLGRPGISGRFDPWHSPDYVGCRRIRGALASAVKYDWVHERAGDAADAR